MIVGIVNILEQFYFDFDTKNGDYSPRYSETTPVFVNGVDEAVDVLKRHGAVFAAGERIAFNPNGHRCTDNGVGRNVETSAHLSLFTEAEQDSIRARVGQG